MLLSPHFTYEEMIFSEYATRQAIDNTPSEDIKDNLIITCQKALEPIRSLVHVPLLITSGYRSIKVNAGIGGVITSQHCEGQAADTIAIGLGLKEYYQLIKSFVASSQLVLDQVIFEFGQWVHVSYNEANNRKMFLIATKVNGKTIYTNDGVA